MSRMNNHDRARIYTALARMDDHTAHPLHAKRDGSCTMYSDNSGWIVWVFVDCCEWDYVEKIQSPQGATWDFYTLAEIIAWKPDNPDRWPLYGL